MNYKLLVDTAILAGEIMVRGGAETYRVEDTVTRILQISGFKDCDVFVVSTSIMVTLADTSIDAITQVRSVGERTTNLGNIYYANDISRKLCNGELELEVANQMLEDLLEAKRYPDWLQYICAIISAVSFAVLFGATVHECIVAAFNGVFVMISRILNNKVKINRFVSNLFVCFIIATITSLFVRVPGIKAKIEPVIAGSIMPLLPGVALTNAIRDTLQGDYVSGTARLVEAFVTAAALAVGIFAGLGLGKYILGGIL